MLAETSQATFATQILYEAAGLPSIDLKLDIVDSSCWLCGKRLTRGAFVKDFIKPTFTNIDQVAVPTSEYICPACIFSFSEQSTILAKCASKSKPQRMRNYSHIVLSGKWYPLSKANKKELSHLLLSETGLPELSAIAVSGQKHIIFRARINPEGEPAGWVQFEEEILWIRQDVLIQAFGIFEQLLNVGFSKSEIKDGNYKQYHIWHCGFDAWYSLEKRAKALRDKSEWPLAVFLAQKGESNGPKRNDSRSSPYSVERYRESV